MILTNPLHGVRKPGMVGKPFPNVQVKIVPSENEQIDDPSTGELRVKSPSVFHEYWNRSDATKQAFDEQGVNKQTNYTFLSYANITHLLVCFVYIFCFSGFVLVILFRWMGMGIIK
jgi:acyl-CoA synthetase (AMP-forming)/AMP-acid ligase II